ncbi:MAG TPA: NAD(P)H-binding protein, partial [Bacteroidota bacterium]|nr:NAD(P)H-binding protein [Bacteroidota bacterium]
VRNIVRAMEQSPARRLIYLSFLAVRERRARSGFLIRNVVSRIVHNEIADHEEKEDAIASSRLEWTIVRPGKLTHGPRTGNYRFGEDVEPASLLPTISRADVADFMLRLLKETAFVRKAPGIMY